MPIEILAARAEEFDVSSRRLGALSSSYLLADDLHERELAEMRLLAQATVEFEVARGLLAALDTGIAKQATLGPNASDAVVVDHDTLAELALLLEDPLAEVSRGPIAKDPLVGALPPTVPAPPPGGTTPPWAGGPSPFGTTPPAWAAGSPASGRSWQSLISPQLAPPTDPAQAKLRLQTGVERALSDIINNAINVGGEAVRGLLLLNMAALYEGIELVSKDAARMLDEAASAIGGVARGLALSAGQLLVHAYDWVLAILGAGTQQQARRQAATWLNQLRWARGTAAPFASLVMRLYTPDAIKSEVAELLGSSTIGIDPMVGATSTVVGLAERYRAKTGQVSRFLKIVAVVKNVPLLATPQGQALAAAVTLGLLSYLLYTGYEHVDSGTIVFAKRFGFDIPHRVDGIRATVRKALAEEGQPAPKTD